jgi:hypothetical protein
MITRHARECFASLSRGSRKDAKEIKAQKDIAQRKGEKGIRV